MFGIGWPEFLVILAVAVIVIGPKDMPRALHSIGKISRKIKSFTSEIQKSIDAVTLGEELQEITREANKAGDAHIDFRIEQQKAIEARDQENTEASSLRKRGSLSAASGFPLSRE